MKISVALCTFNGEKFIEQQIKSIFNQSYSVDEIVAIDDCSEDSTFDILTLYKERYPNIIRLYKNRVNVGYIKNFEKSIMKCTGDIIFLCDQDDIWEKNKVKEITSYFENNKQIVYLFSNGYLINEKNKLLHGSLWKKTHFNVLKKRSFNRGDQFEILLKSNFVTGASLAIRSEAKKYIFPFTKHVTHDHWISLILSVNDMCGYALDKKLIYYRIHKNQNIGFKKYDKRQKKPRKNTYKVYLKMFEAIKNNTDNKPLNKKYSLLINNGIDFFSSIDILKNQSIIRRFIFLIAHFKKSSRYRGILRIIKDLYF